MSLSCSYTAKNFLFHDTESQSWLVQVFLAVMGPQRPQSLTPLASGPLQSGRTSPITAFPQPGGVEQVPVPSVSRPEGPSPVHTGSRLRPWAHLSQAGCSGLEALPSFCWGLSPAAGTSNLGPRVFKD